MRITCSADLGLIIKAKRKKIGMTQKEVAAIAGVGTRFLSELENGKPTLEFDKVILISMYFGIDLVAIERK